MVKLKAILEKLSPELRYGENIMNYEIGDYDFDTFIQTSMFTYEYTNTNNPDIMLRIRDDFPFRVVIMDKKDDITYGTTWNGFKKVKWKRKDGGPIEHIS